MTRHVLRVEPYVFVATVRENNDEYIVDLACTNGGVVCFLSESIQIYRDAWFNAIIQPLRTKNIHLFDRQHVMTS